MTDRWGDRQMGCMTDGQGDGSMCCMMDGQGDRQTCCGMDRWLEEAKLGFTVVGSFLEGKGASRLV